MDGGEKQYPPLATPRAEWARPPVFKAVDRTKYLTGGSRAKKDAPVVLVPVSGH